jgi:NADPH-dependent 2,4-dienoyl-CoA reductase/sulfur reductase-like enzyme
MKKNKSQKDLNRVVVIGCSGCGALAARTLKELNPSLNVTIIREQEEKGLLTRCATPYICCGNVMVDPSYKDDDIFIKQGIELVNVKAVDIDKAKRTVTTADGRTFPYDKLVLATGARPTTLPVPGVSLPGVFFLRTSGDAVNILHWMNSRRVKNIVLIGAGAIGTEVAYLTSRHGINIILVETQGHVMQGILDPDMSEEIEGYMREQGVDLRLKQRVNTIKGTKEVEKVTLSSNEEISAQMVIISAGTRPNSELAEKAGLEMGEMGLKVDNYLRTSDPDIYAGGDLIQYQSHITGNPILGQLRPNAVISGRVIARNISGYKMQFPPLLNSFATKFFEKSIAGTGITETESRNSGIDVISARQRSTSKHSMMREKKPYTVKLVVNKNDKKLVGSQIISDSEAPVKHIDMLSLAIRCGVSIEEIATFRCAGQPELSSDPGAEPIALAADKILQYLIER